MADLKTTYQDDVLDTSVNEKRKYNMIQNADGTVSFDDVTTYSQIGDSFGAADINSTNEKVNEVNSNLTASDDLKFRFATDGEGNYGFLGADDSFIPFKKVATGKIDTSTTDYLTIETGFRPKIVITIATNEASTNMISVYDESTSTANVVGIANSFETIPLSAVQSGQYINNIRSILDNGFTISRYQSVLKMIYYAFS